MTVSAVSEWHENWTWEYYLLYWSTLVDTEKCFNGFFPLKNKVQQFIKFKGKRICEFQDEKWLRGFIFSVHIASYINDLNYNLLGKGKLVHDLYDCMKSFETKLILRDRLLKIKTPFTFLHWRGFLGKKPLQKVIYVLQISRRNSKADFLTLSRMKFPWECHLHRSQWISKDSP